MRKKIGILGGTFDPFHKGHFMLAKTAYSQFSLDEMWIMPNGNPPHKRNIEQTDFQIRCEMIRQVIKEAPYMAVCDYEGSDDAYHFTYQTLGAFHEMYPEYDFYFIIGADSLRDFPTWREPAIIARLCTLLVACRDDSGVEELEAKIAEMEERFGAKCLIMNSPKVDAASSEIRKMAAEGTDIAPYVGNELADYIRNKKLYVTF
ncbi:MAG: nicotinate (nicotinamide) nucleotide adenylyltransferase [Lachnospiraceae bacterium]|nr:nicotinate (nicotinamide) nucleotide adenylyltransferase [Lachnospiraceae bacterium]